MVAVLVTGGFDPIHGGHIEYFKAARRLGSRLIVGLNSDNWLTRKKGRPFMKFEERKKILESLSIVDRVIDFNDDDGTSNNAIYKSISREDQIIFANGGDRNETNTPEFETYGKMPWVRFEWNVGGDKINSSSVLLDQWKCDRTERPWGFWRVLNDKAGYKVKELVINPGCSLSDQRHKHRDEYWYVLEGSVTINLEDEEGQWRIQVLNEHTTYLIRQGMWHKTINEGERPAHILEIQVGQQCFEEDIERRD